LAHQQQSAGTGMLGNGNIKGKVVGLFLPGCVLFSYPVLTLFNLPVFPFGITNV
jgi:hypothetical protein